MALCAGLENISALNGGANCTFLPLADKQLNRPRWSFPAIYIAVICSLVITLNGAVLTSILNSNDLRTRPFFVYIMCLMTFNIFYAALQSPLEVLNYIYPIWWMGGGCCRLYQYSQSVLSAGSMHSHVLIAINRLWAMFFPWSYR